jgi:hypothetical protein
MKDVITCTLSEGDLKRYELDFLVGKEIDPRLYLEDLIEFKNNHLLNNQQPIKLVKFRTRTDIVNYTHDWRVKGDHYMCRDCKIPGQRANAFSPIKPTFEDPMYIDCRWKFKP